MHQQYLNATLNDHDSCSICLHLMASPHRQPKQRGFLCGMHRRKLLRRVRTSPQLYGVSDRTIRNDGCFVRSAHVRTMPQEHILRSGQTLLL